MFEEQEFCVESFESTWKNNKELQNASIQTTEFQVQNQFTNTSQNISTQTQTENSTQDNENIPVDMTKLAAWLKNICPDMMASLNDTTLTNAMSSLKIDDENYSVVANMVQLIKVSETDMHVSAVSWNCTGNTLAVSCSYSHQTWCHHQGLVHLYTFDRDDMLPTTPTKKLLCSACVTSISYHPTLPSLICAGTIAGEIYLWNNQKDDGDNLIATVSGHDEAVCTLAWITNIDVKKQSVVLVSAGHDSFLILWDLHLDEEAVLKIRQKFTTGNKLQQHPKLIQSPSKQYIQRGIVDFDFSPFLSGLFILAMEGGTLIKCSVMGAKPLPTTTATADTIQLFDPTVSYYEKHEGEITSVRFSPHRNELFLSSATDNEIRIYHIDQVNPVQVIFMDATLNAVVWVMHEKKLLIGCSDIGSIRLYSLLNGQLIPQSSFHDFESLTKLAVNKKRTNITAFGNCKGELQLWTIPWNNIVLQNCFNVHDN